MIRSTENPIRVKPIHQNVQSLDCGERAEKSRIFDIELVEIDQRRGHERIVRRDEYG
jgi:hypothetical protein